MYAFGFIVVFFGAAFVFYPERAGWYCRRYVHRNQEIDDFHEEDAAGYGVINSVRNEEHAPVLVIAIKNTFAFILQR